MSDTQYSFDDNGPHFNQGKPDLNLENFDLGPHGTAMVGLSSESRDTLLSGFPSTSYTKQSQAQMIARMGQYKSDVFLFGSPWSYPGWMKQNGLFIAPRLLAGSQILNNTFDPQYTTQAGQYFVKYLDAYQALGVKVNGITLINEPLNSQVCS